MCGWCSGDGPRHGRVCGCGSGGDASRHLRHCCWLSAALIVAGAQPGNSTCCHEDKAWWGWPDSFPERGIAARPRGRVLVRRYMLSGQDISVSARARELDLGDAMTELGCAGRVADG